MMQNEKEIQEAQKQLGNAGSTVSETDKEKDNTTDQSPLSQGEQKQLAPYCPPNPFLGMDPKVMTEFAKQIMLNANNTSGSNPAMMWKKSGSDKPATIAQIIQSQNSMVGKTTTAKDSSEGKIFVYNNANGTEAKTNGEVVIKQEVIPTPSVGSRGRHGRSQRRSNIAPFRNRHGRVLRPGIDNFGRFEAVANPGLIMHAMELLRQKDKKKRGPKEKETFSVFIYCLPDKNSKLPKFSSLDPLERSLVDQHQQEGYGKFLSFAYLNGALQI